MKDCHECFHPKLYYTSVALLVRALGMATVFWQRRLGQLLDAAAGIITLWIV